MAVIEMVTLMQNLSKYIWRGVNLTTISTCPYDEVPNDPPQMSILSR
jgi:hypothetical protein